VFREQKYDNLARQDKERYREECVEVYGKASKAAGAEAA